MMKRLFAVAAMAAAALATLSLAGPSVVSAGVSSHAATGHIDGKRYLQGSAGYQMSGGGWRIRYAATTLTVPAAETRATYARIAARAPYADVTMWVDAGGGPNSVRVSGGYQEDPTSLALEPAAGDEVTLSLYYDRAHTTLTATALDHTQGTSATIKKRWGASFTDVQVMGSGPSWSLASSDTRLWAFKDTRVTSRNGTHGTIFGPWNTYRIIGTRGAHATGKVVLRPSYPSDSGHNFGIWWRAAS